MPLRFQTWKVGGGIDFYTNLGKDELFYGISAVGVLSVRKYPYICSWKQ